MNRATFVLPILALSACYQSVIVDAPEDAGERDAGFDVIRFDVGRPDAPTLDAGPLPSNEVDLLFVIDTSRGMFEEQQALARELPSLLVRLFSGLDGDRTWPPVPSMQIGFVSTDMGSHEYRVPTCDGLGDDGLMTNGQCSWSDPGRFMELDDPVSEGPEAVCTLNLGEEGCGYEQPLEAMLKALTPADSPIRFFRDSRGHGDLHEGFLRPGAQLAVVVLANEDDCSAMDSEIYNSSSDRFTPDLNLRCAFHEEALHPVSRYVDGLLALVPPSRLTFATITGIPVDVVGLDFADILSDPRMSPRPNPAEPSNLTPSCEIPGRGAAYPSPRILRVAQGLAARGARTTNISICQDNYGQILAPVFERLVD